MNDYKAYISSLIDSVHELAGLLQLSLSEGEIPAALPELIRKKASDVSSRCAGAADMIEESFKPDPVALQAVGDFYSIDDKEIDEDVPFDSPVGTRPDASDSPAATEHPLAPDQTVIPDKPEQPAKPDQSAKKKPAGVFTLNDRFLFTRELFGGRRELFDRAMVDLAGMDSYEEAEDFFLYQHGMSPDDPNVAKFLEIVARLFK